MEAPAACFASFFLEGLDNCRGSAWALGGAGAGNAAAGRVLGIFRFIGVLLWLIWRRPLVPGGLKQKAEVIGIRITFASTKSKKAARFRSPRSFTIRSLRSYHSARVVAFRQAIGTGWCQAAEGAANLHSPPYIRQPFHHVRWSHSHSVTGLGRFGFGVGNVLHPAGS